MLYWGIIIFSLHIAPSREQAMALDLEQQIKLYPCFIFDMDGTLVDSESMHLRSWHHVCREFGFPEIDPDYMASFGGLHASKICKILCQKFNIEADINKMVQRKRELYITEYMPQAEVFPKIASLVKELRAANKRVAVATSSSPNEVEYLLGKHNLLPYFHAFVTGDLVEKGKPNPDIYLLAAKYLNAKPQDCLVFEDTKIGMLGAQNAQMDAIKVFNGDFVCDHIITPDEPREMMAEFDNL